MNPPFQVEGINGVTNYFTWNDCDFYLLDNRWDRTIESDSGSILGKKQLHWFLDRIEGSKASVHFVCIGGQVLSDAKIFENYANFSEERAYLLSELENRGVDNVVFLTGDRHHSEVSKYVTGSGKVYYDITSSPLTSKGAPHDYEGNSYTIDKRIIGTRNYAHISVTGALRNRIIQLKYKDSEGKVIQEYELDFKD